MSVASVKRSSHGSPGTLRPRATVPNVIPKWRYHPYLVNGQASDFCYNMNYRVK